MKTKTLTLSYPHEILDKHPHTKTVWRVEKVTDTTEFSPGQYLDKKDVDALCAAVDWKVTIVAPVKR